MENIQKHESQIQISFTRGSSSAMSFYGSDIKSNSYIRLKISKSVLERSKLGKDHYFADETLVEARLSPIQFAELITTLNIGDGVPATLERINQSDLPNTHLEDPIVKNKVDVIKAELEELNDNCKNDFDRLRENIKSLKLSKSKARQIERDISILERSLFKRVLFNIEEAKNEVDKMVVSAKSTIESFYTNMCIRAGIKSIENQSVKLIETQNVNDDINSGD